MEQIIKGFVIDNKTYLLTFDHWYSRNGKDYAYLSFAINIMEDGFIYLTDYSDYISLYKNANDHNNYYALPHFQKHTKKVIKKCERELIKALNDYLKHHQETETSDAT